MSKRQIPFSQRPEPQPFSCGLSTRAWVWGDELLLGFSSRICYAFLERKLSFPEQRVPRFSRHQSHSSCV